MNTQPNTSTDTAGKHRGLLVVDLPASFISDGSLVAPKPTDRCRCGHTLDEHDVDATLAELADGRAPGGEGCLAGWTVRHDGCECDVWDPADTHTESLRGGAR